MKRYHLLLLLSILLALPTKAQNKLPDLPDYSYCGYRASEAAIPDAEVVLFVAHTTGDNTMRIQQAIDYVATLPINTQSGLRGAVLLDKGEFEVSGTLTIPASGIVLRGSDKEESILIKRGADRNALLQIEGRNDKSIQPATTFQKGDRLFIVRPSTKEWIAELGCDLFGGGIGALGWKPGDADIIWDRTVIGLADGRPLLDAPLSMPVSQDQTDISYHRYQWPGRIERCGVENLTLVSEYRLENPKDEDHCWTGVSIEHARDCWVRQLIFKHFAGSAVILQPTASRITVEDCLALAPVSEIGGMRRQTFLTMGQQTLIQRCYSEQGIHDFAAGYCAAGPNAFVQCESRESLGFSGAIDIWAPGLLFDVVNIDGHNLAFKNLGIHKNGAGWNSGNSTFWQCTAAEIECYTPAPGLENRSHGCWAQFSGNGVWSEANSHVTPRSLFYAQLEARLGKEVSAQARLLPINTNATSSPTVEEAMQLSAQAYKPLPTMHQWIMKATITASTERGKTPDIERIKFKKQSSNKTNTQRIKVEDSRLVTTDGKLLAGYKMEVPWWSGKLRSPVLAKAAPHLTRFVPGRQGQGVTDRIDSVLSFMKERNAVAIDHNYGLWYDRRRDDHERIRRRDGDAWGPFYEQPFARSGQGTAWDGMSRYDLTKPNLWYWNRLKEFADKAEQEGRLLYHQNYFQHNILEAGAHWVDSPWRDTNNVNDTGFPEPVPFAGDKRIFVADMFYDISHPVRRELHRTYIRQCLNAFAHNTNVVQLISAEFTGPLHFVRFWLDEIAAWEKETGKQALVALSTTKDVQDAILEDSVRRQIVDIIDIRYWHYKNDGTLYAPEGGKNMAPRQHARKMKVGKVTWQEAYKAVSEYQSKYPDKVITYYAQNYPEMGWAVLMAGGSCPAIPVDDPDFLKAAAGMKPEKTNSESYHKLVKIGMGGIIYSHSDQKAALQLPVGRYEAFHINPRSGEIRKLNIDIKVKPNEHSILQLEKDAVYWFKNR